MMYGIIPETAWNSLRYSMLVIRHQFDPRGRTMPRLDEAQTRVVMVIPGFLGPRSVTRPLQMRFERYGVPAFGFNLGLYSTLPLRLIMRAMANRIASVRKAFPWLKRIDLVGHSMGGIIAAEAIEQGFLDGLETRLVGLGSPFCGTYAACIGFFIPGAFELLPVHARYRQFDQLRRLHAVPFLSLAGEYDVLAPPERCRHPLADYRVMPSTDHAGLILRKDVFETAFNFLARP